MYIIEIVVIGVIYIYIYIYIAYVVTYNQFLFNRKHENTRTTIPGPVRAAGNGLRAAAGGAVRA